jgi:hypothetical protein
VFIKGVSLPQQEKHQFFLVKQSTFKKDVEYSFGLLKKSFNILIIPNRSYSQHTFELIMCAYIILHNMIIDDERDNYFDENYHTVTFIVALPVSLTNILHKEAGQTFSNLQYDLIEYVWNKFY